MPFTVTRNWPSETPAGIEILTRASPPVTMSGRLESVAMRASSAVRSPQATAPRKAAAASADRTVDLTRGTSAVGGVAAAEIMGPLRERGGAGRGLGKPSSIA